ncbi:MAG: GNAT family N-acetyltransferase [Anaerorhabdus sp.]
MIQFKFYKNDENLEDGYQVREAVFVREQGFKDEFDEIDYCCTHVVLYDGEKSVATGRVFTNESGEMTLGRICVLNDYRGQGCGALIIEKLEEKARELGAKEVHLGAQEHALGFYQKLGYEVIGEGYDDQGSPHRHMIKKLL